MTDTTHYAIVSGCNVEPRRRRAEFSLLVAFMEVWWSLCCCSGGLDLRDSGGLVINRNAQLFTFIVKAANVVFHGRVRCHIISGELVYSAYIHWKFVRKYYFLDIFHQCSPKEFHVRYFPVEVLYLDFRQVAHLSLI